jgi:hypothetical protein
LYSALEFIIRTKKHYRSGLDGALLWLSAGFFIAAVNLFVPHLSYLAQAILICITSTFFSLRFAAPLMSCVAFLSLLAIVFYSIVPLGDIAKAAMPFILMAISFLVYFLVKKNTRFEYYKSCNTFIQTLSLITAYAVVNFFVVREVSHELFGLHLQQGSSIAGGWFFWSVTVLMPPIYMEGSAKERRYFIADRYGAGGCDDIYDTLLSSGRFSGNIHDHCRLFYDCAGLCYNKISQDAKAWNYT